MAGCVCSMGVDIRQRILKELKRVDCLELMKQMKAHDCSMNDQFFYSLLKQYTMLRDYEAALVRTNATVVANENPEKSQGGKPLNAKCQCAD